MISKTLHGLLLLFSVFSAVAQVDLPSAERPTVRVVTSGPEWDLVQRIVNRLERQTRFQFPQNVQEVLVDHPAINAWADSSQRVIVLTTGIVRFASHAEGELACIIGHETGHIIDQSCGPLLGRPSTKLDELLGGIFGGGRGAALAKGEKLCEERADEIGLQFMAGAGYNPYDCAASFGRMAMFHGDPGVLGKWLNSSTHPLDWERIMALRRTLLRYVQRFPESSKPTTGPTSAVASVPFDTSERLWKLVQDPTRRWRFRISDQSVYGERVLSDGERQAGDSDIVDARKQGDRYVGNQRVRMTFTIPNLPPQGVQHNACQWDFAVELTAVTGDRIEGRWEGYAPGSKVNPRTCTWPVSRVWEPATWILE